MKNHWGVLMTCWDIGFLSNCAIMRDADYKASDREQVSEDIYMHSILKSICKNVIKLYTWTELIGIWCSLSILTRCVIAVWGKSSYWRNARGGGILRLRYLGLKSGLTVTVSACLFIELKATLIFFGLLRCGACNWCLRFRGWWEPLRGSYTANQAKWQIMTLVL